MPCVQMADFVAVQGLSRAWCFFFFNDTATTEIYTLSLHDALPILALSGSPLASTGHNQPEREKASWLVVDRKSGSAGMPRPISYAVFCLKKKNTKRRARYPYSDHPIRLHHLQCQQQRQHHPPGPTR